MRRLLLKDYWRLTDDQLLAEARRYKILPDRNQTGYLDREYVISQLLTRDNALFNRRLALLAFLVSLVSLAVSLLHR